MILTHTYILGEQIYTQRTHMYSANTYILSGHTYILSVHIYNQRTHICFNGNLVEGHLGNPII